jgi:hypothetical protein
VKLELNFAQSTPTYVVEVNPTTSNKP